MTLEQFISAAGPILAIGVGLVPWLVSAGRYKERIRHLDQRLIELKVDTKMSFDNLGGRLNACERQIEAMRAVDTERSRPYRVGEKGG